MSAVQEFYEVTIEMITWLKENGEVDREARIQKVEKFLEKREAYIENIKPPFSLDEHKVGMKLTELNNELNELLQAEKSAIQKDIKDFHKKKESTNKYNNPYQSLTTDGIFYDKRK